jgi:hypothetical protein
MTLKEVQVGQTVRVIKLHGDGAVKRRIMDMGITKASRSMSASWRRWATPWSSPCGATS